MNPQTRLILRLVLWLAVIVLAPLARAHGQGRGRGAAAPAAAVVADSTTLAPARRMSWTADQVPVAVGTVVTVLIDERVIATASLKDDAIDQKNKTLGVDIRPPASPGAPSAAMKATMDFDQNGKSRKSGEVLRGSAFRSIVSARVVAVSPSGMLRIEGHSVVDVDKNQRDITIKGWARPQDIAAGANTLESSRLADASITYAGRGDLGTARSGLVSRLLGAIWP